MLYQIQNCYTESCYKEVPVCQYVLSQKILKRIYTKPFSFFFFFFFFGGGGGGGGWGGRGEDMFFPIIYVLKACPDDVTLQV